MSWENVMLTSPDPQDFIPNSNDMLLQRQSTRASSHIHTASPPIPNPTVPCPSTTTQLNSTHGPIPSHPTPHPSSLSPSLSLLLLLSLHLYPSSRDIPIDSLPQHALPHLAECLVVGLPACVCEDDVVLVGGRRSCSIPGLGWVWVAEGMQGGGGGYCAVEVGKEGRGRKVGWSGWGGVAQCGRVGLGLRMGRERDGRR